MSTYGSGILNRVMFNVTSMVKNNMKTLDKEEILYQKIDKILRSPSKASEQIKEILQLRPPVEIYKTDACGPILYAVAIFERDYWLEAFEKKSDAIKFCNINRLPIRRI